MVEETIKFISAFDITRAQDDNINAWFLSCVSRFLPQDILLVFPAFYDFSYVNNAREIQLKRSEADAYSILFDEKIKDSIIEHLSTRIGITESYCKSGLASSYLDAWINPDDTNEIQFAIRNFAELRLAVNIPIKTASVDRCERLVQMSYKELFSSVKGTPVAVQKGLRICCQSDSNPFEGDKRFEEGLLAHYCLLRSSGSTRHLYYFFPNNIKVNSDIGEVNKGNGGLFIVVQNKLAENDIALFSIVSFLLSSKVAVQIQKRKVQEASIRSAIGSIMSRNGSHNIGSHVLSALSHNVGTMPDDRVLYQYIQNRMDYIATVTTEPPTWTQPTLLLVNLMRGFLSQYHLLEHIAESEGLRAYEFQKRSGEPDNTSNKIELHVRKCSDSVVPAEEIGEFWTSSKCQPQELIVYSKEHSILLNQDVALAIPGGVVGNHAFYTVLENIIRNAAKHGWSTPPETTAGCKGGNLKIFIDFIETDEDVEFTIWDNMSDVFAGISDSDRRMKPLSDKDIENKINTPEKAADILPLHHRQQVKLAQPFITDSGSLRQENWGLAEMKISVGYLNRREVGAIGGLEKKVNDYTDRSVRIITPVAVAESVETATSIAHLGYRFSVPKPKDIVFVLDNEKEPLKTWLNSNANKLQALRRYGVYFYTIKEVLSKEEKRKRIASQYVVFEDFKEEYLRIGLPFRVLTMSDYEGRFRRELIPLFKDFEILKNVVGRLGDKSASEKIKLLVWRCWVDALWRSCRTDKSSNQLSLIVNTQGDLSGAGRGLITDRDLLQYVFEHCTRSAIRACLNGNGRLSKDGREILAALLKRRCDASVPKVDSGETIDKLIGLKVLSWLEDLKGEPNSGFRLSSCLRREIEHLRVCHKGIADENLSWSERRQLVRKRIEELKTPAEMDGLAASLRVAFDQADVFLRKYEEDIATLPTGFRVKAMGKGEKSFPWAVDDDIPYDSGPETVSVNVCFDRKDAKGPTIEYFRHFDPELSPKPESALYIEPLSGSQCYMNSVCNITRDTTDVVIVKLLEAGLLRVDIADERVAKFCRDHAAMRKTYECLRIKVLDDKDMNLKPEDAEVVVDAIIKQLSVSDNAGMRDIFIIHQGLIDKWLEKHGESDVEWFINKLKKVFRYVVVTTGRGRPANIPPTARVIPFSTVENTLFKKYPEKMVLVDTILNVLPVGPKEAQNVG